MLSGGGASNIEGFIGVRHSLFRKRFGLLMKEYYTTKEIAKICAASERTIIRRITSGEIRAFRLAGGKNFRVSKDELVLFLKKNNIPLPKDIRELKKRILIVDDDDTFLMAMKTFFEDIDFVDTETASSGFQAGLALKSFKPHLVILDIRLGDMDGMELLKVKEADPELESMKILGMSGYLHNGEVQHLLDSGFNDYIAKPFMKPPLMKKVFTLLGIETK
jgi:excisionase family DNA binding protein